MTAEDKIQMQIIKWTQVPAVREKYPELALLYHTANERKCSVYQGVHLKKMGVKSGIPDLHLPVARKGYHGLHMELKSKNGRLSDNQKWWLDKLSEQGYLCVVYRDPKEAFEQLVRYLDDES